MSRVRIYLPLTGADLSTLLDVGSITVGTAFAVTVQLTATTPGADVEELEYAAFLQAAAAAELTRPDEPPARRLIAAADVAAETVTEPVLLPGHSAAAVVLGEPVPLRAVAAFHVDEEPGGTDDADLLWFDASEVLTVRRLLS